MRGYFGIGIERTKTEANVGMLWRSADLLGASFVFTVGKRYKQQHSDTMKSWRNIPLWHFESVDDLIKRLPMDCPLIGIELDVRAKRIESFVHPERACYLLGAEDHGLNAETLQKCYCVVQLPGRHSMNVATAGTVVLYDRMLKDSRK